MNYRNTKIQIKSPEHSKAFQEAIFAAGGAWGSERTVPRHLDEHYLYVSKSLKITHGACPKYFRDHEYEEITFDMKEVELNWIEAAQAIEDGKKIQFFNTAFTAWMDRDDNSYVEKQGKYRIKPKREFTQGWYEYDSTLIGMELVHYSDVHGWRQVRTSMADPIDESKVGKKIK